MMTTMIPKACLKDIHKLQRKFIWGDTENKKKFHVVDWKMVTRPKNEGGMGIRNLEIINRACLTKLGWQLHNGNDKLWCKVVLGEYRQESINGSIMTKCSFSSFWKNVGKLWTKVEERSLWQIRDNATISAWNAKWLGHDLHILDLDVSIPGDLSNANVSYLIQSDGDWKWEILRHWLSENVLNRIVGTTPPSSDSGKD
ncbi:unnamed protein product [Lathyrus sativus]|nr:unnamed protein product [Lathyrus sativus]